MPFSSAAEALRLSPFEADTARKRLADLDIFLKEKTYRAVLRDDSRLAFKWATGQLVADISEIAEEMSVIQFLHDHTNYHRECEQKMKIMAEEAKRTHPSLGWKDVWDIVRIYGADIVKYEIVSKLEDGLPEMVLSRMTRPPPTETGMNSS